MMKPYPVVHEFAMADKSFRNSPRFVAGDGYRIEISVSARQRAVDPNPGCARFGLGAVERLEWQGRPSHP